MSQDFEDIFRKIVEIKQKEQEEFYRKFPTDVPNTYCLHAYIKGVKIENSFKPSVGDFSQLFRTENEKIYIWTHKKDTNSALISKVEPQIKLIPFWKTVGNLINLSMAFNEAFEYIDFENKLEYYWIYYFKPEKNISDFTIFNLNEMDYPYLQNGRIIKATYLSRLAPIIQLLNNDDKCYTATSLLFSSFQIHNCCLICELVSRSHFSYNSKVENQALILLAN